MSMKPVAARLFCTVESEQAGDPLAGTGAHAQRNLLISWPSGKWMRSLRKARDMSDNLINQIEATVEAGRRINLIHREQQPAEQHRVYLMPENLQIELPRDQLPVFLDALNRGGSLDSWRPVPNASPLILCCTHGKKDKCCAKFGNATFKTLVQAVNEGGYNFDVWQSSHLGGCRLAASVMTFPARRKYGRIGPDEVVPFLEAESENRVYLPCYRGNSALEPAGQCAEIAVLQWLGEQGYVADARVESMVPGISGKTVTAEVHWNEGRLAGLFSVQCAATTVMRYDTCADITPSGPSESTVWVAKEIVPVSGLPAD